ncbi:G kinase-anchoring protein 1-like [Macrosteles quadrilineatus]|uniref:G kinase-anchoring protein 1-like n=1 Tax=Macrosteles quadrilineatus TaxID=74068 RepID=UPI0023E0E61F|nr:G kinase-anchoring protein 1-like [Macrosteles quadrilineatus]
MVTPAASRFAILPIDDDGDTSRRITAKMIKKNEQFKTQNNTGIKKPEQAKKKQTGKKNQDSQGSTANKAKPKSENKKKKPEDQWQQWKEKDAQFVDCHYENELQQAILQSKLDYEENKEHYDQMKKAAEEEKKATGSKKNKKSNKAQPMSLSQFNQLGVENQVEEAGPAGDHLVNGNQNPDPEFFNRIKSEAKKALQTEKAEEERKARQPLIDEIISANQFKDRLEKCQEEIERLKNENSSLHDELMNVKNRNKKLCQLLLQGEMKDKAEVLVEVHDLERVKNELSNEVSRLVALLEQEKSKVRELMESKTKPVNKKNVRFNAASETTRSK